MLPYFTRLAACRLSGRQKACKLSSAVAELWNMKLLCSRRSSSGFCRLQFYCPSRVLRKIGWLRLGLQSEQHHQLILYWWSISHQFTNRYVTILVRVCRISSKTRMLPDSSLSGNIRKYRVSSCWIPIILNSHVNIVLLNHCLERKSSTNQLLDTDDSRHQSSDMWVAMQYKACILLAVQGYSHDVRVGEEWEQLH